ncbi:MAG: hypothetical protein QXG05_07345 [Nitrososphaerota archaeon]
MEGGLSALSAELVRKYADHPEVLDALLQWAENPTYMSAGYGIEANYYYIESNLAARYGQETAKGVINILKRESEPLIVKSQNNIYQARNSIIEALEGSRILDEHFQKSLTKLAEPEKLVLATISTLNLSQESLYYAEHGSFAETDFGKKLVAYVNAIGIEMPPGSLEPLLVKSGLVNKLLWISKNKNRYIKLVVPPYVTRITEEISRLTPPAPTYPLSEVISNLRSQQAYAELCVLDEIVQAGGALRERYDQRALPAWKGIVGKHEGWIAVAPHLLQTLDGEIRKIKTELVESVGHGLDRIMETLRSKYWPNAEFTKIRTETDAYWRVEFGVGRPVVAVTVAPWLTPSLARLSGGPNQQLVVFLTNQSFPRAELILQICKISQGITLVGVADDKLLVKKYPNVDPFIDEIVNAFRGIGYQISEQTQIPGKVSAEQPEVAVEKHVAQEEITSKAEELQGQPIAKEELIIGTSKPPRQWGILGMTPEGKIVKFDLNAPHIIFVCGKMGSGKGYQIGVLCEMLISKSIEGISSVSKPATVIVLYNPDEDNKSEFWSIRHPNDVSSEVEELNQYGVKPLKIIDDSKFRVFVDPSVFEKAVEHFIEDYDTQNVFPIYVDPSSLTGKEWAIVLSAEGRTDQQYIKVLFSIIENRPSEQLNIDTIKSDVNKNEKLDDRQKKLAMLRLDMLQNYLKVKPGYKDFQDNLAIGGVNIFDFRNTIRTPDDIFSVMTLILGILQTRKGLEDETFVFVINEAHRYFRRAVADNFVEGIEYLIRRKRHGGNWLILDTHLPDDVDEKVIKLADIKMVNYLDKTENSRILKDAFGGISDQFSKLSPGQTWVLADESSQGRSEPILVDVRPRLTKHGAPTRTAIEQ